MYLRCLTIVLLIRPEDIIDSTPPLVANEEDIICTLKGDHNHACTLARESIVKEKTSI